jgi:hypothetical protein
MAADSAASESVRAAARGRDQQRATVLAGERSKLGPKGRGKLGRKAEGCALASEQHGDARMGERIYARRKALRCFGEARARDAVHGTERGDDVRSVKIVVGRRRHEVEKLRRYSRILDVETEGAARTLDGKGDGNAAPADGDDEARPGRHQRLVGRDGAQQAAGRHIDLQPRRQKPHDALGTHLLQAEGEPDGLGNGDALRLHANRPVGDDPGLLGPGFAAGSNQRLGTLGRRLRNLRAGRRGSRPTKISGT